MKQILLYLFIFTGSFSVAFAQEMPENTAKQEQKIQALYVAYVTQQLNLTEAEAQKFWPVHAQFQSEIKSVSIDMAELPRQQAILDIKKKYQERFTGILGAPRSNSFYRLHGEFSRKLIDEVRKRRQLNNMNQRPMKRKNF